jgi:hypothetical protein
MYLLCRYLPLLLWPVVSLAYVGHHNPENCLRIIVPLQFLQAPLVTPAPLCASKNNSSFLYSTVLTSKYFHKVLRSA